MKRYLRTLSVVLGLFVFSPSHSAEQQANIAFPDTGVWLPVETEGGSVDVVYIPTLEKKKAAVVIIQGEKNNAYQREIVKYLRQQLPKYGYSTLGVNIPHGDKPVTEAKLSALMPKVLQMLNQRGDKKVFVLLYGQNSAELFSCFINYRQKQLKGLVLLSSYAPDKKAYDPLIAALTVWKLKILDIKAQFDYADVNRNFKWRNIIFDGRDMIYRPLVVQGAEHGFESSKAPLMKWLRGWFKVTLKKKPKSKTKEEKKK